MSDTLTDSPVHRSFREARGVKTLYTEDELRYGIEHQAKLERDTQALLHTILPLYTVVRHGEFKCKLREHNQCGPKGTSKFEYVMTIEGHELDGSEQTEGINNFLLEHYAFADFVEKTFGSGKWSASCEAFAGSIIQMAHQLAGGRATRIHVSIKPGSIANIQCEWKVGQQLPSLVAEKL